MVMSQKDVTGLKERKIQGIKHNLQVPFSIKFHHLVDYIRRGEFWTAKRMKKLTVY